MNDLADAMSRRSSGWNSMIVQELPQERSSRFCRRFAFRFGSDVARDHWATHMWNCVLCQACRGTLRQECLRATAQWRKYEDHAQRLVLLHSSGPPLAVTSIQSSSPSCSTYAQKLQSRLRIVALLDLSKRVLAFSKLRQESETYPVTPFFEFVDFLCQVSACSADASLLPEGFILRSFLGGEVRIFEWFPAMDLLFPHHGLGELDCAMWWYQFSNLSPQIRLFSRPSWDTQPNWMLSFNKATDALRHFSLTFCWAGISLSVSEMTAVTMLASGFRLVI